MRGISRLFGLVQGGHYNYEHYRALSRLVVKQASDVDHWTAVFKLIITVSRARLSLFARNTQLVHPHSKLEIWVKWPVEILHKMCVSRFYNVSIHPVPTILVKVSFYDALFLVSSVNNDILRKAIRIGFDRLSN